MADLASSADEELRLAASGAAMDVEIALAAPISPLPNRGDGGGVAMGNETIEAPRLGLAQCKRELRWVLLVHGPLSD